MNATMAPPCDIDPLRQPTSSVVNPTFATRMAIAEPLGLQIRIREQTSVEQMLSAAIGLAQPTTATHIAASSARSRGSS